MRVLLQFFRVVLWLLALFLAFSLSGLAGPILIEWLKVPLLLVFGWSLFLHRTLPLIAWNGAAISLATICLSILFLGTHWFLAGWMKHASQGQRAWGWKGTFTVITALGMLFGISMGITGVAHQAAWLAASKEPWIMSNRRKWMSDFSATKTAASYLKLEADNVDWVFAESIGPIQDFGRSGYVTNQNVLPAEKLCIHPVENPKGWLAAILVYPRDPASFDKAGIHIVTPDSEEHRPASELDSLLAKYSQTEKTAP